MASFSSEANDGFGNPFFHGNELWKSDGTDAGTVMVADIVPGTGGASPHELTNVNGTLFFFANDGIHGDELWLGRTARPAAHT